MTTSSPHSSPEIRTPRVLNKHAHGIPAGAVFCGRGSHWGNPYRIGPDGSRDDVCDNSEKHVLPHLDVTPLQGKDLVCFCDWRSLGQEPLLITPQSRFKPGTAITLDEGILFTTYATLRSDSEKGSRIKQLLDWLGPKFEGALIFDESHAMANAAGSTGERGDKDVSLQGRAGLRLQHALPGARVVYISATGATNVHNLAYAQRLGLWGGADFPFATRAEFVGAIEQGGVAAMEVLARDLKALGLYSARSLSYEGVSYELVVHDLTDDQINIYDSYADAFEIIHNNMTEVLRVSNITSATGTRNAQAKAAARSAFETSKQRFFLHLITSMKTVSLIGHMRADLAAGHSPVIQIVSTSEALMERRLATIPVEDWNDLHIDITPREYVLDYLMNSFPTTLYEIYSDDDGNQASRPARDADGNPIVCQQAATARDGLIEHLCTLTPVQGALDQIIHTFGTDMVAEVTGRTRRIIQNDGRLMVQNRPAAANLSEAQAFMDDQKQILVFSDAGGTGRSYHAELSAKNQRLRVHYLLEPGWKADAAIQGLGRTNRTNQAQPPLFRPVSTNIKAEKRFLSTIARRLDTLGAITKGQRETGGQGLFQATDNLESDYGKSALRFLYQLIVTGRVAGCSLEKFEAATGLELTADGGLRDELPKMTTFLNRLLALRIDLQNIIFDVFDGLMRAQIESAQASGRYDRGLETITAHSLMIADRTAIYTHPSSGAETSILTIRQLSKSEPRSLNHALAIFAEERGASLMINAKSHRAAVKAGSHSITNDDGTIDRRYRLIRPDDVTLVSDTFLATSTWGPATHAEFGAAWTSELRTIPEFAETSLHIVTGLLLPIWKRLPAESVRVFRLQTDDRLNVIGRLVPPSWVESLKPTALSSMTHDAAWDELLTNNANITLQDGLRLRRAKIMGQFRIELTDFSQGMIPRLKTLGLFSELIDWRLRLFVPTTDAGRSILLSLIERYPIVSTTPKA